MFKKDMVADGIFNEPPVFFLNIKKFQNSMTTLRISNQNKQLTKR